jgi:hypothetical protein
MHSPQGSDIGRAKYIYGIVDSNNLPYFKAKGVLLNGRVFLIAFNDIGAIVSDALFDEIDPTSENLLAHELVLREALLEKNLNVAPMSFCTVVGSEHDVLLLLKEGYFSFKKNLLEVSGKIEVGVKVFVDVKKMEQEFGEMTIQKSKEIAETIFEELKKVSEKNCLNDLVTPDMILNASFLIKKGNENFLRQRLVELDKDFTHLLKIRPHGPTAPYNFVSMPTK